MIEDFEPLNSVVRSRQFFYAVLRTRIIFLWMLSTDIQVSSIILLFVTYVRAMVWVRVRLSVVLESG